MARCLLPNGYRPKSNESAGETEGPTAVTSMLVAL
jgi:hypothetical protein